jgi:hypothetical protein
MPEYDSQCTTRTNWFHFAGTHCTLSEPEPLNGFESIKGLLNTELDNVYLPAYFWEQSDTPSPWNLYWTEAAAYGGGLTIDNPVFGNSWTKYWVAHSWFPCDPDLPCECEGHGCGATDETEGRAPAAAETVKVPEIIVTPPTASQTKLEVTSRHW